MTKPTRALQVDSRRWQSAPLAASVTLVLAACSSSSAGGSSLDSGFGFGGDDASTSKHDGGSSGTHDSGGAGSKDAQATKPSTKCGAIVGPDWCQTNAPTLGSSSNVMCDDFDDGELNSVFNWPGVYAHDSVNTHYVSPNCALTTMSPVDSGLSPSIRGTYTEHPYTAAPASAAGTLQFDLFVAGGSGCEGATVTRFLAYGPDATTEEDALKLWVTVSSISGSGESATSYALTLSANVGASGDGGLAGSPTVSSTITVTPRASDDGWAQVNLDVASYAVASAGSVSGKASWTYVASKTTEAATSSVSATGTLMQYQGETQVVFDVGVAPDPATSMALTTCTLYLDNIVSNIVTPTH